MNANVGVSKLTKYRHLIAKLAYLAAKLEAEAKKAQGACT